MTFGLFSDLFEPVIMVRMKYLTELKEKTNIIAALSTCLAVLIVSMVWLSNADYYYRELVYWMLLGFIVFTASFCLVTADSLNADNRLRVNILLVIMLVSAFGLMLLFPLSFLSILTIIWISVFSRFYRGLATISTLVGVMAVWYGIFGFYWQEDHAGFQLLLYSTFHGFALLMGYQTQQAEAAKQKAEALNAELVVANKMIEEFAKDTERTRIARDLHDLLGHHLTALIINLQVVGHKSEGQNKEDILECHRLAKLLLSDVREAVSKLRETNELGFNQMLEEVVSTVPRLKVTTHFEANIAVEDTHVIRELLCCVQEMITNTLRHSSADALTIESKIRENTYQIAVSDNGKVRKQYVEGNGIKGIRERAEHLGGGLSIDTSNGFACLITIPMAQLDKGSKCD